MACTCTWTEVENKCNNDIKGFVLNVECAECAYNRTHPNTYIHPTYNADELIAWALNSIFALNVLQHESAFIDFANKATQVSANNFRARALLVDMSELAETIIAKAIELGANIE